MNDEKFDNFLKIVKHDCFRHMNSYLDEQITENPEMKDFYEGIKKSDFFRGFFEAGFIFGVSWQERNKNTKYVL